MLVCAGVHMEETETLPDFTRVYTEFLVEKATGQIIHEYWAIAGAWLKETESETAEKINVVV